MKNSKKLFGILAIICIVVVVSGCTTSNNTSNTSSNTTNTSNSNTSTTNASSSNDVNVVINYTGSWAADISGNLGYRGISGTGDQTTNLGSVTGPVTASARKTDSGSGTLIVSITKGGKTLSTASTSAPYGGATAYFSV